jgi:hypothetical protein
MFRPLKDYLSAALQRTGAAPAVTAAGVVEAAGPLILQVVPTLKPADFVVVSYRDGWLTVAVAHPAVGAELRLHDDALLDVLRDTFPGQRFVRVRTTPLVEESGEF